MRSLCRGRLKALTRCPIVKGMSRRKGFTLIELLVVIAIIGLLSSIVLASLSAARVRAQDASRKQTIDSVRMALELYYDAYGHYPWGIAYSPWHGRCAAEINWDNCNTSRHGNPMGDLIRAHDLISPVPLPQDPAGDQEGGAPNYLGDGYPTDRGFVYCSGDPATTNCPDAPTTQHYVLGTNVAHGGNFRTGDNPKWGDYQFHE